MAEGGTPGGDFNPQQRTDNTQLNTEVGEKNKATGKMQSQAHGLQQNREIPQDNLQPVEGKGFPHLKLEESKPSGGKDSKLDASKFPKADASEEEWANWIADKYEQASQIMSAPEQRQEFIQGLHLLASDDPEKFGQAVREVAAQDPYAWWIEPPTPGPVTKVSCFIDPGNISVEQVWP